MRCDSGVSWKGGVWSKLLWEGFSRFERKFLLAQVHILRRAQLSWLGRLMARACAVLGTCLDRAPWAQLSAAVEGQKVGLLPLPGRAGGRQLCKHNRW